MTGCKGFIRDFFYQIVEDVAGDNVQKKEDISTITKIDMLPSSQSSLKCPL